MGQLRENLLEELNSKNMLETIGTFNHLFRYSGTKEGEVAVSYLKKNSRSMGFRLSIVSMMAFSASRCEHSQKLTEWNIR